MFERVVIASGDSNRQVKALADRVQERIEALGARVYGVEGADGRRMGAGRPRRRGGAHHASGGAQLLQPGGGLGRQGGQAEEAGRRSRRAQAGEEAARRAKREGRRVARLHVVALDARLPAWAEAACAEYAQRMPQGLRGRARRGEARAAHAPRCRRARAWSRSTSAARTSPRVQFAELLSEQTAFVIGGADGLDAEVKRERVPAAAPVRRSPCRTRSRRWCCSSSSTARRRCSPGIRTTESLGYTRGRWPARIERGIYLASRSPRRRELLAQIGVRFHLLLFRDAARADAEDVNEDPLAGRGARAPTSSAWRAPRPRPAGGACMQRNLPQRAGARRRHHRGARRPHPRQARRPRRSRATCSPRSPGTRHEVLTAVALQARRLRCESALSRVARCEFKTLVGGGDPRSTSPPASATTRPAPTPSRAAPARFVVELRGSYSGVMGLPLYETAQLLEQAPYGAERAPMSEEILINVTPQETRVAVTGAGAVQELLVERAASRGLVGNIYLGRGRPRAARHAVGVRRDRPGARGVPARGRHLGARAATATAPSARSRSILAEGQTLLVQVVKDPIGTKGARLSTQVSIAGRLLVYLPQDPHIGISQRIEDEAEREHAARAAARSCMPRRREGRLHRAHRGRGRDRGRAARRHRVPASRCGRGIQRARARRAAPQALLYQDLSLAQRVLRDIVERRHRARAGRLARDLPEAARLRRALHAQALRDRSSTTPASGRCSTSTTSRTRSSGRSRAAST